MRVDVEQALYLGRMLSGAVLAWVAVWVAFGPELSRAVGRLLTWREGRLPAAEEPGAGSPPSD
jgi:hypothetical protein